MCLYSHLASPLHRDRHYLRFEIKTIRMWPIKRTRGPGEGEREWDRRRIRASGQGTLSKVERKRRCRSIHQYQPKREENPKASQAPCSPSLNAWTEEQEWGYPVGRENLERRHEEATTRGVVEGTGAIRSRWICWSCGGGPCHVEPVRLGMGVIINMFSVTRNLSWGKVENQSFGKCYLVWKGGTL